ncbi:pirin family protein [Acuticoccus mangrovi]|uniref:Pirin family protein n=1 Tax=Acuticoccus mangrovi TaxID=2796142 RepID=A0A934IR71_9HYPH|nr:pirin family protein [Acuticoccus mangrovi]MBJ3778607.1 pirin family protein [Acuticoccus mangrovi]
MSYVPCPDPAPGDAAAADAIETIIVSRSRDLGGFEVRRALPSPRRRMVGPFIFFDQMGPAEFVVGEGIDVRPHPHINLATVTYLFDGEIMHRDSLGTEVPIRPGAVNLMTAGRGIVHSERTAPSEKAKGPHLFGLQTWVALPQAFEEMDPAFAHIGADDLPMVHDGGTAARLIAGSAWGATSPLETKWPMIYADISLDPGASIPIDAEQEERAIYTVSGEIMIGGVRHEPGALLVLRPGDPITITNVGVGPARSVLVGGATMDGPRYIWWNFVSSRKERIEQAKAEWKAGRFDSVPGDAEEFIPLPE